ncbi:MAG: hypothetical protein O3C40_24190 [Planctomycetota bacterium]|nr:hypothetical protein [Planctomycetota bacterium]
MKRLLIMTTAIELGAGMVLLLCCPSAAVRLLLGSPLDSPAAVTLGRGDTRARRHSGAATLGHGDTRARR